CTEQTAAINDISEDVEVTRNRLRHDTAGFDRVVQVHDRRARLNNGFLAHRLACNHLNGHEIVWRRYLRNLRVWELLVAWLDHLVTLWQVHPKLESVHSSTLGRELGTRHFRVDHTRSGSHPLHIARSQTSGVSARILVLHLA